MDLTFKTVGCDGRANAWYQRPSITLCYEYLHEISKNIPKETTPAGITPDDAVVGQFFYVVAHEFGHAVFDLLSVPSFGNAEDTADQFATYLMLHFGKDEARRLISGAAYSYRDAVQNSTVILPLQAFSDVHGVPAQRFFNLLCVAYGADPQIFAEAAQYLPKQRAADCKREYNQVGFAFQQTYSTPRRPGPCQTCHAKVLAPRCCTASRPVAATPGRSGAPRRSLSPNCQRCRASREMPRRQRPACDRDKTPFALGARGLQLRPMSTLGAPAPAVTNDSPN